MNHVAQQLDLGAPAQRMRGRLTDAPAVRRFLEAGNATLTVASRGSGQRYTFNFKRPEQDGDRPRPTFVKLLSGPDNNSDYSFVGTLFPAHEHEVRFSKKSRVRSDAPSAKSLAWFLHHMYHAEGRPEQVFRQAEVWHEGRCGRCGRRLTVPESIGSGFGPDCAAQMGGSNG